MSSMIATQIMAHQGGFLPYPARTPSGGSVYPMSNEPSAFPPPRSSSSTSRDYDAQPYRPVPDSPGMHHFSGNRTSPTSWNHFRRESAEASRSPEPLRLNNHPLFYSNRDRATVASSPCDRFPSAPAPINLGPVGHPLQPVDGYGRWDPPIHTSPDSLMRDPTPPSIETPDFFPEYPKRRSTDNAPGPIRHHAQRRPANRDEFDGPTQYLAMPSPRTIADQEQELPHLPTTLEVQEQDQILCEVNDRLSKSAFDFVAKYQFPIPLEPDKREVRVPADREWTEWVYLLKRLATKRRIPARVLYNGQIKQFVTILENSLEMRHAAKHQSRPVKDDRNILQLISAGTQVAKILKDASAMQYLDRLYVRTEMQIQERRSKLADVSGS